MGFVSRVICKVARHQWQGCRCLRCGRSRAEGHDWHHCVCRLCHGKREEAHEWNGCTCVHCDSLRHEWGAPYEVTEVINTTYFKRGQTRDLGERGEEIVEITLLQICSRCGGTTKLSTRRRRRPISW